MARAAEPPVAHFTLVNFNPSKNLLYVKKGLLEGLKLNDSFFCIDIKYTLKVVFFMETFFAFNSVGVNSKFIESGVNI